MRRKSPAESQIPAQTRVELRGLVSAVTAGRPVTEASGRMGGDHGRDESNAQRVRRQEHREEVRQGPLLYDGGEPGLPLVPGPVPGADRAAGSDQPPAP